MAKRNSRKNAKTKPLIETFIHEKLSCWKISILAAHYAKDVMTQFGDMRNQLERSVLSVSNNIAEACGRHLKGGKNVEILFTHANGSLGEMANMLFFALNLHVKASSFQGKAIKEFFRKMLMKAFQELNCIIVNPVLLETPENIGIFQRDEVLILNYLLDEVNAGKDVRHVLAEAIVDEKQLAENTNGSVPKETCTNCQKKVHVIEGVTFNLKLNTAIIKNPIKADIFICNRCVEKHGKPRHVDKGIVIFDKKNSDGQPELTVVSEKQ